MSLSNGSSFGTTQDWSSDAGSSTEERHIGDYNGDGKSDIGIRVANGRFWVALSTGTSFQAKTEWTSYDGQAGWGNEYRHVGDYDGDGKSDLGIYVPSTQHFWVSKSTGSSLGTTQDWLSDAGASTDGRHIGDYNGDGSSDIGIYVSDDGQGNTGRFWVAPSTGSAFQTKAQWTTYNGQAGWGNEYRFVGEYDGDGVTDDGCPSATYIYDALDRLTSTTDALGRMTSYSYDAASNLTERVDARGLITRYFPDDLNLLDYLHHCTADAPPGPCTGSYLVDSVDYSYNAVGFRTQMVDPTGTTSYTPDALDRITSVTFPGPKTVSYEYDDAPGGSAADYPGQRTKITYPDTSKYVNYTYHADGRMSTVTDWLGKQTVHTYDDNGALKKTQLPNGTWTDYLYDAARRLATVENKKTGPVTISSFTYTVDSVGNRTQMIAVGQSAGTHSYQYDALYRLAQVTYPGPTTDAYTYDANGNRLTKNLTSYSYNALDQLTAAGGLNYTYDNNGNQTGRGSDTFTYDHENRLTQTVISGATSSSTYNGDGLRMSHTVSGNTTNYTLDVAASLPVVLQDGTNTYVYGLDLISATDSGGAQTYFLYDGLGSTSDVTDGSGNAVSAYSYDVFGAIRSQAGSSSNYWLFTGEQRDSDSSMYYLRARYYDPAIGRFLTEDPIRAGHTYGYVGNNPVNAIDPFGLCEVKVKFWETVKECTEEAVDEFSNDPVGTTTKVLDTVAFGIDAGAAYVTDYAAVAGCGIAGPKGCAAGYAVGWLATQPAVTVSNGISAASATLTCLDTLVGVVNDDPKEGQFFRGRSSVGDCIVSASTAGAGWLAVERNAGAVISGYQLCYDIGQCPAYYRVDQWWPSYGWGVASRWR